MGGSVSVGVIDVIVVTGVMSGAVVAVGGASLIRLFRGHLLTLSSWFTGKGVRVAVDRSLIPVSYGVGHVSGVSTPGIVSGGTGVIPGSVGPGMGVSASSVSTGSAHGVY